MTANPISTEIGQLSMTDSPNNETNDSKQNDANNNSNSNSSKHHNHQHSAVHHASYSQPNMLNDDNTLHETAESNGGLAAITGTAYTYASSTFSGAYSYMASFYPASSQPQTDLDSNKNQQKELSRPHSQSMSAIITSSSSTSSSSSSTTQNGKSNHAHQNGQNKPKSNYDASKPDLIKYPMQFTEGSSVCFSDLPRWTSMADNEGLTALPWAKNIKQPSPNTVPLRSTSYKLDGKKAISGSPVFKLAYAQAFKTEMMIDHIAMHPVSWFNQNIALDDMSCFTLIVHLQVKSLKTSFITYHVLDAARMAGYNSNGTPIVKDDPAVTKLLDLVLNSSDRSTQNNRWKLVPRIVEGPYPVKRVVENRPVLLGNKVTHSYYRGANYFEIDSKVDDSMVAASIIKLCHRFAKRIVVDMAWTLQGEEVDELPERLVCGVTIFNMDFSKCGNLNSEMQTCHKLRFPNNQVKQPPNHSKQNGYDKTQDESKQDK